MANPRPFTPDYAAPPGEFIGETLQERDMSARELARRCGRSAKLMAEIVSGKAALEPETAMQIERVLGIDAETMLRMESRYRLRLAREQERQDLQAHAAWLKTLPIKALAARDCIARRSSVSEQIEEVLRFFQAGSPEACEDRWGELLSLHYRTSPAFDNNLASLAAWLQLGERKASKITVEDYDRGKFLEILDMVRPLTRCDIKDSLAFTQQLCASCGVALVVEEPLTGVRASGVSRWLAPGRPLIQLSFRYHANDHFWFTFFHECAHILFHSRKATFVDMSHSEGSADPDEEEEANRWAAEFLIPRPALDRFIARFTFKTDEVVAFANEQGIAPGIVVGQLQHRKVLRFNQMTPLKRIYEPCEISEICVSQKSTNT